MGPRVVMAQREVAQGVEHGGGRTGTEGRDEHGKSDEPSGGRTGGVGYNRPVVVGHLGGDLPVTF
jgi:hypothetical protein